MTLARPLEAEIKVTRRSCGESAEVMNTRNRLKRRRLYYLLAIVIAVFLGWLFSTGIQFQPRRPMNLSAWRETPWGGGVTYVGQFVLQKGESTDNGQIGVRLVNITSKPCPFATICLQPEAKASLRFYRPADQSVICETTLDSSSTSYDARRVCAGLPFTNIDVREINTREDWAFIAFFNLKDG